MSHLHDHAQTPTSAELESIPVPPLAPYRFIKPSVSYVLLILALWCSLLVPSLKSSLATNMRAPTGGPLGFLASFLMTNINTPTIIDVVARMNPTSTDHWLELGPGAGIGLQALYKITTPASVTVVEVSERFAEDLKTAPTDLSAVWNPTILTDDARQLPTIATGTITKIMAVNVVYFLDPLPEYLTELKRVLAPNGQVLFACKFHLVSTNGPPFVNVSLESVLKAFESVGGFEVRVEEVAMEERKFDYTAITATKI